MMDLVEFSELLVKKLVKEPDLVKVQQFDSEDETVIEIVVAEDDMGRVIGKKGKIANSIKSLIQAKAYNDGNKKVKVNIDSF
ncbi:MAG: KH domain-containing protein [Bacilli bacterium]|nr:KH domain-containing protein [Bacilli bacterium]